MKIHERMSEKRCFYMIVFLAVILFVLSGCEKQQPESESVDSIPTINIGISARTGLSKNPFGSQSDAWRSDGREDWCACPTDLDRAEQQSGKQLL